MTTTTLTSKDWRALGLWLFAAVIGVAVVLEYHDVAFPSASIDFRITRNEAEAAASAFLRRQGFDPALYRAVTTFNYDDIAKVYLERELGLEEANRLMESLVPVWQWDTRFFIPRQQEEFSVSLNPSGRLVGFDHEIEEDRDGAVLALEEAQQIAERFLTDVQSLDLTDYRRVEGETVNRDNRADHTFTWERLQFKAQDATVRITVTVQGDRIGGYAEYLKVPEAWQRDFAQLRSRNTLMQIIAEVGFFAFLTAILVVFVREIASRQATWRFGVKCGVALAVTSMALTLNTLPLTFARYETTQSLGGFYGTIGFLSLLEAGGWFLGISMIGAVGVAAYRRMLPDRIAPEWLLSRRALTTREYLMACIVGYLMPLVLLGYITSFYLIGNRFGVWVPADVDYTDLASTTLPWLFPLTIGIQASVFEEFVFRLFAIPFLKKYLKSTFLAVLIPAVCWGFLHSNYPQQPFFIRGLELTAVGVLFGYVFIRYGIVSTLIAHYVYDALLTGLFLFQSPRLYFQVSASIVVGLLLIPLAPSLIALVRRRLTEEPSILNAAVEQKLTEAATVRIAEAVPAEDMESNTPAPVTTTPLTRQGVLAVGIAALVSLTLMAAVPVERVFDFVDIRIDRPQAITVAETHLAERGVDTGAFRRATTYSRAASGLPMKYIRQREGVSGLNETYRTRLDPAGWTVRFFKPLEKEEYLVTVGIDGAVLRYDHRIDETAEGARLTQAAALATAAAALREGGVDLGMYRLVESNQEERDARIDHVFEWEDTLTVIDEGRFRYSATVQGDEVVRSRPFFKPPEAWVREQQESTFADIIIMALTVFGIGGVVVFGMRLFVARIRERQVDWRFSLTVAGGVAVVVLFGRLNALSAFYAGYDTTMSLESFTVQGAIGLVLGIVVQIVILGVILIGMAETLYRMQHPDRADLKTWFRETLHARTPQTRAAIRDALMLSYAACLILPGVRHLLDIIGQAMGLSAGRVADIIPFAGSYFPAIGVLFSATANAVMGSALLLVLILIGRHYLKTPALIGLASLALAALMQAGNAETWLEFFGLSLNQAVFIGVVWLGIRYLWRDNLPAYVLTFFLASITGDAWTMINGSTGAYRMTGVIAMGLAVLPLMVGMIKQVAGYRLKG